MGANVGSMGGVAGSIGAIMVGGTEVSFPPLFLSQQKYEKNPLNKKTKKTKKTSGPQTDGGPILLTTFFPLSSHPPP
jgi:hypothetical protein